MDDVRGGARQRAGRSGRWSVAACFALLLAAGCSSPQATVSSPDPDRVLQDVLAFYVVVAPQPKIDPDVVAPNDPDRDPFKILRTLDPARDCRALLQLAPTRDAKGELAWKVVEQRLNPGEMFDFDIEKADAPGGGEFDAIRDPIEIAVSGDLIEQDPTTAILLFATFRNGAARPWSSRFVGTASIAAEQTQVFELRDQDLIRTK